VLLAPADAVLDEVEAEAVRAWSRHDSTVPPRPCDPASARRPDSCRGQAPGCSPQLVVHRLPTCPSTGAGAVARPDRSTLSRAGCRTLADGTLASGQRP
jgi:hypothetical protein